MIINQIKEMDEERKQTLWEFSFRAFKLDILNSATFEDDKSQMIKEIIQEMNNYEDTYASSFHGSFPNSQTLIPKIKENILKAKITIDKQSSLMSVIEGEILKKTVSMKMLLDNISQIDPTFNKKIEHLKKLRSIQVELSTTNDIKEYGFSIISKISFMIQKKNNLVSQKTAQYAGILEDYNYVGNLLLSFDNMKSNFQVPKVDSIESALSKLQNSKLRLERSLSQIKNELLGILEEEIKEISNSIRQNKNYEEFRNILREAKQDKLRFIREERVFKAAVEDYRDLMRELSLIRLMIVRLSPYDLIKFSNQAANIERIEEMYPENYSPSLLNTSSFNDIVKALFEENKKLSKYHKEYLLLSKEAQQNMDKLVEKETQLDIIFAEIWSKIQSIEEEGKEK
jgi:hypothetical protein